MGKRILWVLRLLGFCLEKRNSFDVYFNFFVGLWVGFFLVYFNFGRRSFVEKFFLKEVVFEFFRNVGLGRNEGGRGGEGYGGGMF